MKNYVPGLIAIFLFAACLYLVAAAATMDSITAEVTRGNDDVQLATLKHDTKTMGRALTKDFILVERGPNGQSGRVA